jgi:hypothetical protein
MNNNDCKKKKQYIISFLLKGMLFTIFAFIMLGMIYQLSNKQQETIEAFNNNEEIICSNIGLSTIVSKQKGYHFDINYGNCITNGDTVVNLSTCKKRDKHNGK